MAPSFDLARLGEHLRRRIDGFGDLRAAEPLRGGQSNPTFALTTSRGRFVLRKQPDGPILPSAHAVDREYRVTAALAATAVPVAAPLLYEPDPQIVGTPFFVMPFVDGRVFHDTALPGLEPAERAAIYDAMNATMAALHRVDWQAIGLDGFGRVGGYFARQVQRWSRQLEMSRDRPTPVLDGVRDWLEAHLPEDDTTTIVHGDLRLGNLMFAPDRPEVVALLDWELATLGHPLADVAFNCIAYHSAPSEYGGLRGLDLAALGIPAESDYLERYYERVGGGARVETFHLAFALFRFAVIFEGIRARAAQGTAAAANAKEVGPLGAVFARIAAELIEQQGAG